MKAKEYYQKLITENLDKSFEYRVISIIHEMAAEMSDIMKQRKVTTDSGGFAIMKEQNQKCNSFIKMVNQISSDYEYKENAFLLYIEQTSPTLYESYKNYYKS